MLLDEGYMFGLGAFETILVENWVPLLLDEHLARLRSTLKFLDIDKEITGNEVCDYIDKNNVRRGVLKLMVSQRNVIYSVRNNPYTPDMYARGFRLDFSDVLRNETSPFTYHKTFNYGDCILEKRKSASRGLDELIFLNRFGEICEGTTTNIFFARKERIKTPSLKCGLLAGILRNHLLSNYDIEECVINRDDIYEYDECFVTNSVLGIMPVRKIQDKSFTIGSVSTSLRMEYIQRFNIEF